MGHETEIVAEYVSVVEPDGVMTLPPEIQEFWGLKPGDKVEFFQDHLGGWRMRPRNAGPLEFLKYLPPRRKRSDALTDDEALTKAMSERHAPPAAAKATG